MEQIQKPHRGKGLTIGIIDSTFSHHPRGEKKIYGVYRYWDYVNGCYTYALQLVTAAMFNFVRPHLSLRVALPRPTKGRKWERRTPAMVAGLTDHIWALEELLSYRVPPSGR